MSGHNIDYTKYSLEQLFEAFETVDDQQYPENALAIYRQILIQKKLSYKKVSGELLGYGDKGWFDYLVTLIPFIAPFEMDEENLRAVMQEKVLRLNHMLDNEVC